MRALQAMCWAAAVLALSGGQATAADGVLIVGTGAVTGTYDAAGGAVARVVTAGAPVPGFRLAVESTNGAAENLRRLRAGELELGIASSDQINEAALGVDEFAGEPPFETLRTVLTLYPEPVTIIARADAGIAAVTDLAGKRVNLGIQGSRSRQLLELVLAAHGVAVDMLGEGRELPLADQTAALCDGTVDAVALVASHPSGTINAALATCPSVLIPVDPAAAEALVADHPYLAAATIPGGLYPGVADQVLVVGPVVGLVATTTLPAAAGHAIAADAVAGFAALAEQHPVFFAAGPDGLLGPTLGAPWHEGTEQLLRERAGQ